MSNIVQNNAHNEVNMSNNVRNVMVIVHPGSCCGSADMNLGRYEARSLRDGLVNRLQAWTGPIFIIDGTMSDEIHWSQYEELGRAIRNAIRRARYHRHAAKREWGCDDNGPGSSGAMEALLARGEIALGDRVYLTGAWTTNHKDWGCINGAAKVLDDAGIRNEIDDSAFFELDDEAEVESEADDELDDDVIQSDAADENEDG